MYHTDHNQPDVDYHNQVDGMLSRVSRAEEMARRHREHGNEHTAKLWDQEAEKERAKEQQ